MTYLLAGLGAYSVGAGWFFFVQNDSFNSFLIGNGLGLILIFGAVVVALGNRK
jgi:hypothetical protein